MSNEPHGDREHWQREPTTLQVSAAFANDILNSLTALVAVLDAEGAIILVNSAWERFARENALAHPTRSWIGVNYFEACGAALSQMDPGMARAAAVGIRSVLDGQEPVFKLEYSLHVK